MKLNAATADAEGYGVTVEYDPAALTVSKAQLLLPRLYSVRATCSMAIDTCRALIAIAEPETARKTYVEHKKGTGTSE